MGRPHKGDRALLQTRPRLEVTEEIRRRQHNAGVSCMSQYLADVLAIHVGRPDLVVELGCQGELPLGEAPLVPSGAAVASHGPLLQTRPHADVWAAVHKLQRETGVRSVRQYVADVLALHVGRPDLVIDLGRKRELPLGEELPLAM